MTTEENCPPPPNPKTNPNPNPNPNSNRGDFPPGQLSGYH